MKLKTVLSEKGGKVITLDSTTSLWVAAGILDENRIGTAVAVRPDGDLCGVLSERDIVRRIAQHGSDALALSVDEAMTREVVTATPDTSLDDALSQMTDRRIRHLPVVDQGKLVGIVSIGDLVKRKISATELEAEAMKQYIAAG